MPAATRCGHQGDERALARQEFHLLARALDAVSLVLLLDPEEAARAEADEAGGEATVVEPHLVHVAHARRAHALRRVVARERGPRARIAPHQVPAPPEEQEQRDEADRAGQHAAVVPDPPAQALEVGRLAHDALGKFDHDAEPLLRTHRARGAEARAARARLGLEVAQAIALVAGVGLELQLFRRHRRGQRHVGRDAVHGEGPAVAVHVPVQLVVVLEEAELARGAVGDLVDVPAARQHHGGVADADARAVAIGLHRPGLGVAVAAHRDDMQRHPDARAAAVAVIGGEIAQDAALDFTPFDLHLDALGDGEPAVRADADVAVEVEHPFLRRRGQRGEGEGEGEEQDPHSAIFTAARSSVSKNGSGGKPNRRATSTSGKLCRRVTYCFTAPL
jgi:hypothetical protein